jgi:hypothetical protein
MQAFFLPGSPGEFKKKAPCGAFTAYQHFFAR